MRFFRDFVGTPAFLIGMLIGFAILPLLSALPDQRRTFELELTTQGDDMSRHGVASLSVTRRSGEVLTQRCVGICDDLTFKVDTGDDGFEMKALDERGACVACSGSYTTNSAVSRQWLSGDEKLAFSSDFNTGYQR